MTQPSPDFPHIHEEEEEDDQTPSFSRDMPTTTRTTREEEIMELTWHGGPVMVHQRSSKRSSFVAGSSHAVIPTTQPEHAMEIRRSTEQHMFIQEDEMATWLQHNLDSSFDRDLFADLIYSAPPLPPPPIPVISPQRREILPNFPHFANIARFGIGPRVEPTVVEPVVVTAVEKSVTMVESNETPELGQSSQTTGFGEMDTDTGEGTMGSSAGGSVILPPENPAGTVGEGKGKAKDSDDSQCEEIGSDSEAIGTRKQGRSSVSKKRQRVAEVHNLSERKRRDRMNERIRTLQELVPGCNKLDKASILDDAIEYLKSMQLQLQMISMGFGMIPNPMIFPGMQQYMPTFGMGMGLNRPIHPHQTILAASAGQSPADTAEPRFSGQALNPSRIQASDQAELMLRLLAGQSPNMQQLMPNFLNPYQQQFLALQHAAQVSSPQTQGPVQPSGNKPSSSKDIDNPENRQTDP